LLGLVEICKGKIVFLSEKYSGVIFIVRNGLKLLRVIILFVSEKYSVLILSVRDDLKLVR
jgi:hypothetical protein